MANSMKDVFSKWGRSPRQDRRVVVNGKFVELTDPIHPTPEPEGNTALEIVHEPNAISGTVFEEARYGDDGGAVDAIQSDGSDGEIGGGSAQGTAVPESIEAGDQTVVTETPNAENLPPTAPEVAVVGQVHDETIVETNSETIVGKTFTFVELPPVPQEIIDYLKSTQDEAEKASGLMKENPDVEPD